MGIEELAQAMHDAAIRYANGHTVDFQHEAREFAMAAKPDAYIQGDHLAHAVKGAHLCRVEAKHREGYGLVPLWTIPVSGLEKVPTWQEEAIRDALDDLVSMVHERYAGYSADDRRYIRDLGVVAAAINALNSLIAMVEGDDTRRLNFLDKFAVIAKPGQPVREAIDAEMTKQQSGAQP